MSDINLDDTSGDGPDTFDGRLAGIVRLIDTFGDETNDERRRLRRVVIARLLTGLLAEAADKIAAQADRASVL